MLASVRVSSRVVVGRVAVQKYLHFSPYLLIVRIFVAQRSFCFSNRGLTACRVSIAGRRRGGKLRRGT